MRIIKNERTDVPSEKEVSTILNHGYYPFTLKTKKALLSISDGRASSFFNTFLKIITPPPFLRAADFRVQRYEEKMGKSEKIRENRRNSEKNRENQRKTEKFRENQRKTEIICKFMGFLARIICKFMCISAGFICKSLFIYIIFVSFFCSKTPTPQGSFTFLPFYLFTFNCPCRKNRNYYLCTMRLPESER